MKGRPSGARGHQPRPSPCCFRSCLPPGRHRSPASEPPPSAHASAPRARVHNQVSSIDLCMDPRPSKTRTSRQKVANSRRSIGQRANLGCHAHIGCAHFVFMVLSHITEHLEFVPKQPVSYSWSGEGGLGRCEARGGGAPGPGEEVAKYSLDVTLTAPGTLQSSWGLMIPSFSADKGSSIHV